MISQRIELWPNRHDVALYTFLAEIDPMLPGPKEKLPAVLICPGGAYMFCSMSGEGDATAMAFASAGYQTFVLEYTVGTACGEHSARYPAQLLDYGKAVMVIREHAEEWHVDPERICVAGFSAGAHLCGTVATRWHEPLLSETFGVPAACFRPMAAILGYGLMDYVYQEEYNATQPPNPILTAGNVAFFGCPAPAREQLEAVSPYLHVSEHTPPVFMMHAASDTMVPALHSLKMAQALAAHSIPYELHIFQNGEHGFATGAPMGVSVYRKDKYKACGAWVELAKTWLLHWAAPETAEHDVSSVSFFEGDGTPPPFFR